MSHKSLSKYTKILLIVSLLAFTIRLIAGWQMYSEQQLPVQNPTTQTDMHTYMKYGRQFVEGTYTDHGGAYYYQPFYYAVFLRFLFTLFGSDPLVVVVAQAILGALTVLLVGMLGARLGGKKAGIVAALIMTLYRDHILYTPYALMAVLQTFLITLAVYLIFEAFRKRQLRYWALTGLVMSCSILCRGNFLLLIPFILFFIWRSERQSPKKTGLYALVFLVMIYLPQLPFSIKNYQVTGKWTGPSTAGDVVLALGNNPDTPAGTMDSPFQHYLYYDDFDEVTHWQKEAQSGGKSQGDSVKKWIFSNPLQWLELKFRVLSLYVSNERCHNNITLQKNAYYIPWLGSVLLLDFWIVAIPFMVLLCRTLLFRQFKKTRVNLLLTCIVVYTGSIVLFYVLSRYKLPIIPLMAACAGAEFIRWSQTLRGGNKRRKIILAGLLVFATAVNARWYDMYEALSPAIMRTVQPTGTGFEAVDAIYLKDHPNECRGGWQSEEVSGSLLMKKIFQLNEDVDTRGYLRLMINGNAGTLVNLQVDHGGQMKFQEHLFERDGWTWLEIPLKRIISQNKSVEFAIEVKTTKGVGVKYTKHRNYGRSFKNGLNIPVEWIVQLKIDKKSLLEKDK